MPLPALLRCKLLVGFQLAVAGPAAESLGNQPTKKHGDSQQGLAAMYLSSTRYVDVSFPTVDRSLLPNVTHTYLLHCV